jgi:hypothetical protein
MANDAVASMRVCCAVVAVVSQLGIIVCTQRIPNAWRIARAKCAGAGLSSVLRMSETSRSARSRRASARFPVVAEARITRGSARVALAVEDLSLGGMRARGDALALGAQVGHAVHVRIVGGGAEPFDLVGDAKVVRVDGEGIAVEWTSADPQVAEQIMILLATLRAGAGG